MSKHALVGMAAAVVLMAGAVMVASVDSSGGVERGRVLRGQAAALHEAVMRVEDRLPAGRADDLVTFAKTIDRFERALVANNRSAAVAAWRDAYGLALRSSRWEPMVEVADAALALGAFTSTSRTAESSARDAYMIALVRARRAESGIGVQRATDAIAALANPATARVPASVAADF